jgi:bacterioferritin
VDPARPRGRGRLSEQDVRPLRDQALTRANTCTLARRVPANSRQRSTFTRHSRINGGPTMARPTLDRGVLSQENQEKRMQIIELLKKAYWMEMETVMSYIANSTNPDGVRAQEIIEALQQDIQEELGHAQQFASRIKELWGVVPGSLEFSAEQDYLQPPQEQTDIVHVVKGVIEAEKGAIDHYNRIIEVCDGVDWTTQDMVIAILRDEEGHLRLFEGFLREFEIEGKV